MRPEILLGLAIVCILYLRGFRELRAQLPGRLPEWRRNALLAGLVAIALALLSPLDAFADLLLQVHMAQHWLLMMVAPPLLWLGAPVVPLLRGLPRSWLKRGLGPFLAWRGLRRVLHAVTHPVFAWLAWALATLVWHWPPAYQLALASQAWHEFEHLSFLCAALLFWYPVLAPWPSRPRLSKPARVLYLGLAALFNTVFSAAFAFSTRVFYPAYLEAPRLWGLDPLADQNAAGAFLWVAASLPMLAAAVALLYTALEPRRVLAPVRRRPLVASARGRGDLLALPRVGAWLRSRVTRRALQWTMLALAAVVVLDGLLGPRQPSALNLAGVLPWTYWRGLVVIGLLLLGNLFCAVCPFTLPRSLAGRWLGRPFRWPAALANKWLAIGIFALYLWAYEAFALWDSPWWTAWIVVGYFAACFLVEGLFPRGSFCRYLCPIGQFHFVGSGISPLEVRSLEPERCARCTTHDCLRGNAERPGCPTGLFLPQKSGGLDCTLCLDCVRACPHDNAGLLAVRPAATLGRGRLGGGHSGGGHSGRAPRLDLAALALLFSFGAFANAATMLAPVAGWERAAAAALGFGSTLPVLSLWLALALVAAPAGAAWLCAWTGRSWARLPTPAARLVASLAPALVPIGFAMWLVHFGFHLVAGLGTAGPAVSRVAQEVGLALAATGGSGMAVSSAADPGLPIALLGVGLVVSVAVAWRLAREQVQAAGPALRLASPWLLLAALLYSAGVWITLQPMEMRGMVMS